MRAVAYLGHVDGPKNGLYIFKPSEPDRKKLPANFGGISGAGLWRVFLKENEGGYTVVGKWLIGVANWGKSSDMTITCQGFERLYQRLVPEVRKQFPA